MVTIARLDYRRAAQTALAVVLLALVMLAAPLGGLAHGSDYGSYGQHTYSFATGEDGKGYYKTYDGYDWSGWWGWDDQPAYFRYQPSGIAYQGAVYVFYTGKDGGLYYNATDGYDWFGWYDVAGGYRIEYAPYAKVDGDYLYLYIPIGDGSGYYRVFDGYAWSDWASYSDDGYSDVHHDDQYDDGFRY